MRKAHNDTWIYVLIIGVISMILLMACYAGQYIPALISSGPTSPTSTATTTPATIPTLPPITFTLTPAPIMPETPTAVAPHTPEVPLVAPEDGLPQYKLDITLYAEEQRISVVQDVLVHNTSGDSWTEVVFQLIPAHIPQNVILHFTEVTLNTENERRTYTVQPHLDGIMLHVPLPMDLSSMGVVEIALVYEMGMPEVNAATWMPEGNLGAGEFVIQAGDWHAALVPYENGQGWMTWSYTPVGDPFVYSMANYEVGITTAPDWTIAAPGWIRQEGSTHLYELKHARSFAFFASRDYEKLQGVVQDIPLTLYYLPGYEQAAKDVMIAASQALWLYSELYGPYPMRELVIVQNAYYGSMEYSSLISLSQDAFDQYDGKPDSLLIDLTAHEIAHQWWYGAVGVNQVHEPWLDESFAKYSEYLFYERYYPELTNWWWEVHVYGQPTSGPIDRSIYDYYDAPRYIRQLYPRGARFLADLRQDMGDAAFFDFVQSLRRFGEGRIITSDAFFTLLEDYHPPNLASLKAQYFAYLD